MPTVINGTQKEKEMINNNKFVLEAKYPIKRVIPYIHKHIKQKKKPDLSTSLELTENHFLNKNVRNLQIIQDREKFPRK